MRISDWSSYVCSSDLAARRASTERGPRDGVRNLLEWLADVPDSIGESALIDRIDDLRPRDLIGIAGVNARFSWLVLGPLPGRNCHEAPVRALRYACQHRHFRSEEHTSELQSLMRTSYAVFCLKKKK